MPVVSEQRVQRAADGGAGSSQKTMWPVPGTSTTDASGFAFAASSAPAAVTTGLSPPWISTVGAGTEGQTAKKSSDSKPACVATIASREIEPIQRARSSCSWRGQRGQDAATSSASVPRRAWSSWPRKASSVVGYGPRPGPLIGGSTSTVARRSRRVAARAVIRAPMECPSTSGRPSSRASTTAATSPA